MGLVAAARTSGLPLLYAAYPIAPASDVLHRLAELKRFGVRTFQAEDEIAAMGAAIGAAFGGGLGATATSGPGLSLKSEAIGLAVMAELPVVVIDVQRGGPSLGLPTKTEQADLFQALYGRHGECPVAVLARALAGRLLRDGLRSGALGRRPHDAGAGAVRRLSRPSAPSRGAFPIRPSCRRSRSDIRRPPAPRRSSRTGATSARCGRGPCRARRGWNTASAAWRRKTARGAVSYDPLNHERMVRIRAEKIARIADDIPELAVDGPAEGDLLVVGWGGTFGAIATAVRRARAGGLSVGHAHFRYLNPMPRNTRRSAAAL